MEPVLDQPQRQKHSWKSVELCMVTEQTKSPRINATGNRKVTTNMCSYHKHLQVYWQKHMVLVSAF